MCFYFRYINEATYHPLHIRGIRILQNLVLPCVHPNALPHWPTSSVNPASLVCLSSSLLVDKRSTSTMNLKQPSEAGISKRLSSSSATLIKSPDKSKSPLFPPSFCTLPHLLLAPPPVPSSYPPCNPVICLNQGSMFQSIISQVNVFQ